jgi:hypothetical protein
VKDCCPRCTADLFRVVSAARFCPNCGARLADGWKASGERPDGRIDVVRGYAAAMFRLGEHYEFRRNEPEAERCFGKASRLGHGLAGARAEMIPFARLSSS